MHSVDVWHEHAKCEGEGPMIVGLTWLQTTLKALGGKALSMELRVEGVPVPEKRIEDWTAHLNVEDRPPYHQSFDIGGKWPNVNSLIEHGDILTGIGFNPGYFFDMVTAARSWWDLDTPDETFPLQIVEMHPQKVCTFALRNAIGRLRITIMPKVSDDDEY